MVKYLAHNSTIRSSIELPEYLDGTAQYPGEIGIAVECRTGEALANSGFCRTEEGLRLWWKAVGEFDVRRDGTITARRNETIDNSLLRLPLLGSVLAAALHFIGRFILHGNALAIGGQGVVFVGDKGEGKSTLTTKLLEGGHRLIADDLSTVSLSGKEDVHVHRGSLHMRLWPDTIERCLGRNTNDFDLVQEGSEKRVVPAHEHASDRSAMPLQRIYVLTKGADAKIVPLSAADAWREVMTHSYVARFGSVVLHGQDSIRHFTNASEIARRVAVSRLYIPRDFGSLGMVSALIERDLQQNVPARI